MKIVELKAEQRQRTGKNACRKVRLAGKIPAVLYGEKIEPEPIMVDARDFYTKTHGEAGASVIFKLKVEGGKSHDTIIKNIHRHPLKNSLMHIDFLKIALDEKIHAAVPVTLIGESPGVKAGGVLQHGTWEITVEALPKDIPEHIEIDISNLEIGTSLKAADLTAPEGVTILSDPEEIVVTCLQPTKYEEVVPVAAEEEAAEEEVAAAEASEEEKKEE